MYLVSVYLQDLAYGGPEEGGWYYTVGELARTVRLFRSEDKAYEYSRRLNDKLNSRTFGPNLDRPDMSSVLSEGLYFAEVHEDHAPKYFPEKRPRYE
jgi:hypothetical protein